jgi:hypothetical protein
LYDSIFFSDLACPMAGSLIDVPIGVKNLSAGFQQGVPQAQYVFTAYRTMLAIPKQSPPASWVSVYTPAAAIVWRVWKYHEEAICISPSGPLSSRKICLPGSMVVVDCDDDQRVGL